MALHTSLPIYKAAYALLDAVTDFSKNMPRPYQRPFGGEITSDCIKITILIFRANVAQEKAPYLQALQERLQVVELMIRLAMDKRLIPPGAYAKAIELTTSIGKQATGWGNSRKNRPHHAGQGRHD